MDVRLLAKDVVLTSSLRAYLRRCLRFAFSRMRNRIDRVEVRLGDLNGPRGGHDMVCQLCVSLPGQKPLVVREVQDNMYRAISWAVKRAAYRVARTGDPLPRNPRRYLRLHRRDSARNGASHG